jgi:exonuclease III
MPNTDLKMRMLTFNINNKDSAFLKSCAKLKADDSIDVLVVALQETTTSFDHTSFVSNIARAYPQLDGASFISIGSILAANFINRLYAFYKSSLARPTPLTNFTKKEPFLMPTFVQKSDEQNTGYIFHSMGKWTSAVALRINDRERVVFMGSHLPFDKKDPQDAKGRRKQALGQIQDSLKKSFGTSESGEDAWILCGDLNFRFVEEKDQGPGIIDEVFGAGNTVSKVPDDYTCKVDKCSYSDNNSEKLECDYVQNRKQSKCDRFVFSRCGMFADLEEYEGRVEVAKAFDAMLLTKEDKSQRSDHLPIMFDFRTNGLKLIDVDDANTDVLQTVAKSVEHYFAECCKNQVHDKSPYKALSMVVEIRCEHGNTWVREIKFWSCFMNSDSCTRTLVDQVLVVRGMRVRILALDEEGVLSNVACRTNIDGSVWKPESTD